MHWLCTKALKSCVSKSCWTSNQRSCGKSTCTTALTPLEQFENLFSHKKQMLVTNWAVFTVHHILQWFFTNFYAHINIEIYCMGVAMYHWGNQSSCLGKKNQEYRLSKLGFGNLTDHTQYSWNCVGLIILVPPLESAIILI